MRIYIESSPAIYLVEHIAPYEAAIEARLAGVGVIPVSSELTRMECRVKPLRNADAARLADFDVFFSTRILDWVMFTRPVFDKAAEIRARYRFKTPDALHLAAAIVSVCDVFLTNDQQLTRCTDITVEVI